MPITRRDFVAALSALPGLNLLDMTSQREKKPLSEPTFLGKHYLVDDLHPPSVASMVDLGVYAYQTNALYRSRVIGTVDVAVEHPRLSRLGPLLVDLIVTGNLFVNDRGMNLNPRRTFIVPNYRKDEKQIWLREELEKPEAPPQQFALAPHEFKVRRMDDYRQVGLGYHLMPYQVVGWDWPWHTPAAWRAYEEKDQVALRQLFNEGYDEDRMQGCLRRAITEIERIWPGA